MLSFWVIHCNSRHNLFCYRCHPVWFNQICSCARLASVCVRKEPGVRVQISISREGDWCRVWGSACAVRQSSGTRSKPLLGSKRDGEGERVCVHVGGCVGNGDSQWFCMRTDACSELTVHWPWDAQKSLEAFPPEEITQPSKGTVCFLYIFYCIQTDEQVRCAQSSAAASASLIHKKWYRACITLLAAFSFSCLSSFILLVSI